MRLVSGDNIDTATEIAIKAGIITAEEAKSKYTCMPAEEFRKMVGGMRKELDGEGREKLYIQNKKEFQQIAQRLRVLSRAIPYDKHLLVTGLKELNRAVAVTGDGINDADALRAADVGFAMGSGVSVAKDAADMILIEDNFEATMKGVMWGRNIYDNVRRFLQFQMTVNISCLATVFIGAAIIGESPLKTVQLLWINMIMDTLAALALATERPHPSIIRTPPTRKDSMLITPFMWRQIYGISAYMILVMIIQISFAKLIWDLDYKRTMPADAPKEDWTANEEAKSHHLTLVFNTFVFLQLFNEFNCRVIQPTRLNIFANIFSNFYFLLVVIGAGVLQVFFVEYTRNFMQVYPINSTEQAYCMLWGASVILVSTILKLTPAEWVNKLPIRIDENKEIDPNDKILSAYNKQAQAKVSKGGAHPE